MVSIKLHENLTVHLSHAAAVSFSLFLFLRVTLKALLKVPLETSVLWASAVRRRAGSDKTSIRWKWPDKTNKATLTSSQTSAKRRPGGQINKMERREMQKTTIIIIIIEMR